MIVAYTAGSFLGVLSVVIYTGWLSFWCRWRVCLDGYALRLAGDNFFNMGVYNGA